MKIKKILYKTTTGSIEYKYFLLIQESSFNIFTIVKEMTNHDLYGIKRLRTNVECIVRQSNTDSQINRSQIKYDCNMQLPL